MVATRDNEVPVWIVSTRPKLLTRQSVRGGCSRETQTQTQNVAMEDCCRGVMIVVTLARLHESLQEDLKNMQRFACLVAVLSYWTTHKLGFKDAVLPIYTS